MFNMVLVFKIVSYLKSKPFKNYGIKSTIASMYLQNQGLSTLTIFGQLKQFINYLKVAIAMRV